jgi:hypothetical protein
MKANCSPVWWKNKFSYVATFEEIQENDFNLNIPRYVDTFEEEAEVDIAAVQKEIEPFAVMDKHKDFFKYVSDHFKRHIGFQATTNTIILMQQPNAEH